VRGTDALAEVGVRLPEVLQHRHERVEVAEACHSLADRRHHRLAVSFQRLAVVQVLGVFEGEQFHSRRRNREDVLEEQHADFFHPERGHLRPRLLYLDDTGEMREEASSG